MQTMLVSAQILLSILLIVAILLQSQGGGFGATWQGGGETYHTRRGLEKVVFYATIVMVGLFIALSMALVAL